MHSIKAFSTNECSVFIGPDIVTGVANLRSFPLGPDVENVFTDETALPTRVVSMSVSLTFVWASFLFCPAILVIEIKLAMLKRTCLFTFLEYKLIGFTVPKFKRMFVKQNQ